MRISFRLIADKLFGKKSNILVGRWNIDYDNVIQERKVYLNNMDHCGCCGNISNNTKNIQNINILKHIRPLKQPQQPKRIYRMSASKYIK
jgi:Ser-tRNA(Ala) deacylase AlaX